MPPLIKAPGDEDDFAESATMESRLLEILGEDAFVMFVENQGGLRVFIPKNPDRSSLSNYIWRENVERLAAVFGGEYIIVPLARAYRMAVYKRRGYTHSRMARLLGVTENAVCRMAMALTAAKID
jgi:hypothetical protein